MRHSKPKFVGRAMTIQAWAAQQEAITDTQPEYIKRLLQIAGWQQGTFKAISAQLAREKDHT